MTQTRLEHDLLGEREVPIECYYGILTERCITGITANREVCRHMVEHSIGLVTALNPYVGYEKSTRSRKINIACPFPPLAETSWSTGVPVRYSFQGKSHSQPTLPPGW